MKLHHKIAAAFGYRLLRKNNSHLIIDDHLKNIIEKQDINLIIDVGANEGQFYEVARQASKTSQLISVEPIPELVKQIKSKFSNDSKFKIYNCAAGEKNESIELTVYASSVFSSFLPPSDFSNKHFPDHLKIERKIPVEVKRLDEILSGDIKEDSRILLKIDTQGFDMETFRGFEKYWDQVKILCFECSVEPVYQGSISFIETLKYFTEKGFKPTGFFPVSRGNNLQIIEFDVVMVK